MRPSEIVGLGDVRSLARVIRWLDDAPEVGREVLKQVYHRTGRAWVIGVTGPAGVGKSSLINHLIRALRSEGRTVGVIAVDPTSPFTGGAILGDRIRMQDHEGDPGVFIRSVATRGQMGGLSRSTLDIVDLMDSYGMEVILVETVGVGQDETDVARVAHTVLLVLMPGLGDEVQALKAGLMEIAHVFVINKKDRGDAERMRQELRNVLSLAPQARPWRPPIVLTDATRGAGLDELVRALWEHRAFLERSGEWDRRRQQYAFLRLTEAVRALVMQSVETRLDDPQVQEWIQAIAAGTLDPYSAAMALIERFGGK
ncbi:MAG: methylmalonyl Co-A mutase-associated GTPase MeaB [Acidobacteria bacterium]|nr:methylmalonyl Co-A mutase-associated GTPase MeaB [Acidobacteriota bacterium]MDW7983572.1 methylmalonyl Co-A mutase-associated GTPase MeaB [Acidobacteriota bacterium]